MSTSVVSAPDAASAPAGDPAPGSPNSAVQNASDPSSSTGPVSSVETTALPSAEPTRVSVSNKLFRNCAISPRGAAWCWGWQYHLGAMRNFAMLVPGLESNVQKLAVGGGHLCALFTNGSVRCLGDNGSGQLGDDSIVTRRTVVTPVGMDADVIDISIAVTSSKTCAVKRNGKGFCWGHQATLGDVSTITPTEITGVSGAKHVVVGSRAVCFETLVGEAQSKVYRCFGPNDYIHVGRDIGPNSVSSITDFSDIHNIKIGASFSCVLRLNGQTWCSGANEEGQLADGSRTNRHGFVRGPSGQFDKIELGAQHGCGLGGEQQLYCWGTSSAINSTGYSYGSTFVAPVPVAQGYQFLDFSVSAHQACGVSSLGVVRCAGSYPGNNAGTPFSSSSFVQVVRENGQEFNLAFDHGY